MTAGQGRARTVSARVAVAGALASAVLAPLAFHWLAGRTLVWFDTQRLYAPQRWLVDEALRAFRLPLWNPYMGAGMPFLADAIHGVLHPVSVVTAWLRTDRAADVLIGGYVACAGLGANVLARALGASRSAAAVAAFAYGMSGYVLSMAGNLVFLAGAGSLPWCVAGLLRFSAEPRPSSLAFGAGGAAALALSGDVQALVVGGAFALALAWEAGGWRGAARAVAAGTIGVLGAGVQLVPTAVHVGRTVRSADLWTQAPALWALEPWRIPELVLPGLLRGTDPFVDPVFAALARPGSWPAAGYPMPFAASICVGLVPVALAIAGVREGGRGRILGALALVSLWIALGPALGASAVLGQLPIWRAFRYSEKLVGPFTLALAALAALGFDAVVARRVTGRTLLAIAGGVAAGAIAAWRLKVSGLAPAVASLADDRLARGAWQVLLGAASVGVWVLLRRRWADAPARASLAVLVWVSAVAAAPEALHPGDPASRLRAPGPELQAEAPGPRIVTPYFHDTTSPVAGEAAVDLGARVQALLAYPAWNVRSRLDSLNAYVAMDPTRLALVLVDGWVHWPLAPRRYAVTHLVLDPPVTRRDRELHEAFTRGATLASASGGLEIWNVPHRPWASFPERLRAVPDPQQAVADAAAVLAEDGPTVVVEAFSPFAAAPGRVLSVERGLESVRVEAEAEGDATLLVADAWWPGWEATLDGVPVSIFRADLLVRAVRWPAGRHLLEMRYRPPEVRRGLLVSAAALGAAIAWMAWLRSSRLGAGGGRQA